MTLTGSAIAGPLDDARAADNRGDDATAYARERLLADQGNAEAQYRLSYFYLLGKGVTKDSSEAISWLRRAGYQGFALAGLALCLDYANGLGGVEQNYFEAVEWCRLAADKGIPAGKYRLGLMYARGQGVLQNYILANMWLNLAGFQEAMDARDRLAALMTPAQVAEARPEGTGLDESTIHAASKAPKAPAPRAMAVIGAFTAWLDGAAALACPVIGSLPIFPAIISLPRYRPRLGG